MEYPYPILDAPDKMANYLTDNVRLQNFLTTFLTIKDETERKKYEADFWQLVKDLPLEEQASIKSANEQISQRMYSRMNSIIVDVHNSMKKPLTLAVV
jgi:adenylate kinase